MSHDLDLGKCLTGKLMIVKVRVFRLGHFARSKIKSESIFLIKYYIITILIFFGIGVSDKRREALKYVIDDNSKSVEEVKLNFYQIHKKG